MKAYQSILLSTIYTCGGMGLNGQIKSEKPNIIILVADDLGWGDIGYYGHPIIKTPNLDDMAKSGLRFDRFYAAAPVSSPTRGSILTGRHPNRFECFTYGHSLRPQEITIAESLQNIGYKTGQFGKWHLGTVYKESPVNPGNSGFDEWLSSPNFFENDPILSREGITLQMKGESSMVVVNSALEFIEKHAELSPFFAYICFGSPHQPHIAKEQDRMPYLFLNDSFQQYYGEITGMDRAIGFLRNKLKELGIEKNTIVWFLSDNGGLRDSSRDPKTQKKGYLSSTGGREYKGSIYEGGLRVPAIIEWPERISESKVSNITCVTSDIFPTLLDIVGIKSEHDYPVDGISLIPLIDGEMDKRAKPIGFWSYPAKGISNTSENIMNDLQMLQSVGYEMTDSTLLLVNVGDMKKRYSEDIFIGHSAWLDWPHKLHRIEKDNIIVFELYNLEADPWEEYNIFHKETEVSNKMSSMLNEWMKSVLKSLNGYDY